jgi:hypothetical protein
MSDELIRSLGWVGLVVGFAAVALLVEVLLRTLINRRDEAPDSTMRSRQK